MDHSTLTVLTAFVVVTAIAVVVQMGILVALFVSVRKTSAQVLTLADSIERRAVPALDAANAILVDSRGRMTEIVANLAAISSSLRSQVDRFDVTFSDAMDRTQRQVIRADNMVSRTMDHVEETTEVLHEGVLTPVRRVAGLVQGLTVGIDTFFKLTRKFPRREHAPVSQDEELFI
jgi:methyl-accepting chemotaxis protein